MRSTQLDSIEFAPLLWPYDLTTSELADAPRQVTGSQNTFVTTGGKITKRPGTISAGSFDALPANRKPARLYQYETLNGRLFYLCSMRHTDIVITGGYELYYYEAGTVTSWTSVGSLRDLDNSTNPHEVVVQRGVAYIRGVPDPTSTNKYSTVIFDGNTGGAPLVRLWGLPAPTVPCRMSGRTALLTAAINSTALALTINTAYSPAVATPFTVQIDDERIRVTAIGGGTNWTITRGYDGTVATNHDAGAFVIYHDWATSAHAVDVVNTWKYTYAWVSLTGHISARAPLETNPDLMASATFPFFDQIPKMNVQGHADTTNIPSINIYRTTDGGGTYFYVGNVTNTGAGNISFEDKYLGTGASSTTYSDPIPDDLLDQANVAPSLTSNIVPPPVAAPLVIGTDSPQAGTNLASYSGRIWFGINNFLYYSGLEEITEGVPEECFPAGLKGNYFKFQHKIISVTGGMNALYVITTQHVYKVTGTDQTTFNVAPLLQNIGGYSPTSVVRASNKVIFMTHDRRIGVIYGNNQFEIISLPLGNSLSATGTTNAEFTLVYWGEKNRDLMLVFMNNVDDQTLSKCFVYDLALTALAKDHFWHPPWTIPATCAISTKVSATGDRRLVLGQIAAFRYIDFIAGLTFTDAGAGYDWVLRSHLMLPPGGNHLNKLRIPAMSPVVARAQFDRTRWPGDVDPEVTFCYDDFWSEEEDAVSVHEPTIRESSKYYKTLLATADRVATRVALGLSITASTAPIDIHNLTVTWTPDAGATS